MDTLLGIMYILHLIYPRQMLHVTQQVKYYGYDGAIRICRSNLVSKLWPLEVSNFAFFYAYPIGTYLI